MLHIESKYVYKNIIKKQKVIDCMQSVNYGFESNDEKEHNKKKNGLNKIINTQDFNSIMNQSLLSNNQEFPLVFFHKKNEEDSIVSVEDIIKKINFAEENHLPENKEIVKSAKKQGTIY